MNAVSARAAAPRFDAFDLAAPAGRLLMAAIFLLSGWAKVTSPAFFIGYAHSAGLPAISVADAIPVELVGGALLLIGCRSRIMAAVLAVFTLVAASFFRSAFGDPNQFNQECGDGGRVAAGGRVWAWPVQRRRGGLEFSGRTAATDNRRSP